MRRSASTIPQAASKSACAAQWKHCQEPIRPGANARPLKGGLRREPLLRCPPVECLLIFDSKSAAVRCDEHFDVDDGYPAVGVRPTIWQTADEADGSMFQVCALLPVQRAVDAAVRRASCNAQVLVRRTAAWGLRAVESLQLQLRSVRYPVDASHSSRRPISAQRSKRAGDAS